MKENTAILADMKKAFTDEVRQVQLQRIRTMSAEEEEYCQHL